MLLLAVLAAAMFFSVGCRKYIIGNVEISKIVFPGVAALDFAENEEDVIITLEAKRVSQSERGGEFSGDYEVLKIMSGSVFEAGKALTAYSVKDINWGQNECIIFGEDVARDNILKHVDYFVRNHENRGTIKMFVANGVNGGSIIEQTAETGGYVSDKALELYDDMGTLSISKGVRLHKFLSELQNQHGCGVMPAVGVSEITLGGYNRSFITAADDDEGEVEGMPNKMLVITGYAVFKDNSLLGFMDAKMSRGLNWVTDDITSAAISLTDSDGEKISLEVISSATRVKTRIEDGVPSLTLKINVSSNIAGYEGKENIFLKENIAELEDKQRQAIENEIREVLAYAKLHRIDIFGFNGFFNRQNPVKWEKLKDDWQELFPRLAVEIDIKSKINRTYSIKIPLREGVKQP